MDHIWVDGRRISGEPVIPLDSEGRLDTITYHFPLTTGGVSTGDGEGAEGRTDRHGTQVLRSRPWWEEMSMGE